MERYKFCDKHVSKRVNATKQINKRSKAKTEEQGQGSPNSELLTNRPDSPNKTEQDRTSVQWTLTDGEIYEININVPLNLDF